MNLFPFRSRGDPVPLTQRRRKTDRCRRRRRPWWRRQESQPGRLNERAGSHLSMLRPAATPWPKDDGLHSPTRT